MEKVSQALQALKDMQNKAEEVNRSALQSYEENLKDTLQSVGTTFEADIAQVDRAARNAAAERYKAYELRQLEQFQQSEALLDQCLKSRNTKLEAYNQKAWLFLKSSSLVGLGIIGISIGVAGLILAWSVMITKPQTEALQQKNSELQKKVDNLQQKIDQQQPKTQKRK
jgi:tRNA(Met) C34 N-acetyltransferase TmcA